MLTPNTIVKLTRTYRPPAPPHCREAALFNQRVERLTAAERLSFDMKSKVKVIDARTLEFADGTRVLLTRERNTRRFHAPRSS